MKKYYLWMVIWLGSFISLPMQAQPPLPELRIAADRYSPPFVMRGANNQLFGFDIDMMEHLCQLLKRKCVYLPLPFEQILPAILTHQADIGVGAITITLERSRQVAFSIPYLLSYAQYISLKGNDSPKFNTQILKDKRVGVETSSIFKEAIEELNFSDIKIIELKNYEKIMQALQDKTIDYALVDAPTAQYWKTQSDGQIVPVGKPFLFGYGFGIALNIDNPALLEDVNTALLEYQNNGGFQKAYNQYIAQF